MSYNRYTDGCQRSHTATCGASTEPAPTAAWGNPAFSAPWGGWGWGGGCQSGCTCQESCCKNGCTCQENCDSCATDNDTAADTACKELLMQIYQAGFLLDEVKLYLDTHPCCQPALYYYRQVQCYQAALKRQYNCCCGPLTVDDDQSCQWRWAAGPWPWEKEV